MRFVRVRGDCRPIKIAVVPAELNQRGIAKDTLFNIPLQQFKPLLCGTAEFARLMIWIPSFCAAMLAAVVLLYA